MGWRSRTLALSPPAAGLALLALALLGAPASAGTYAGPTAFADGAAEHLLNATSCGALDNATALRVPHDANVSSLGFDVEVGANSTATSGWFTAQVWGYGSGLNITVAGPSHANLSGSGFNEYLTALGATSGTVDIPLTFGSCPSGGNWTLRLSNLSAPLVDVGPPTIVVANPQDGYGIGANEFDIQLDATVFDARSGFLYNASDLQASAAFVDVSTDQASWSTPTVVAASTSQLQVRYLFTGLGESVRALYLRAHDVAGNFETRAIPVVVDRTAPVITVLLPGSDPSTTNQPTISVSAETETGALVYVDGVAPTDLLARPDGLHVYFTVEVPLVDGLNRITVAAIDALNNQAEVSLDVFLDRVPPTLVILDPTPGAFVNRSSITVRGQTEPTGATVAVEGQQLLVDPSGNFSATVALADGLNSISVEARDAAGNVQVATLNVTLDTAAPVVHFDGVGPTTVVNRPQFVLTGTVDLDALLFVDGHVANATAGAFAVAFSLGEGANVLEMSAVDLAGNRADYTLIVILDTAAPDITLTAPSAPAVFTNRTALALEGFTASDAASLWVAFDDASGARVLKALTLRTGAGTDAPSFSDTIELVPDGATHTVTVSAVDLAHNEGTRTFTYLCKLAKPSLALEGVPLASASGAVWVKGTTDPEIASVAVNGVSYPVAAGAFAVLVDLPAGGELPIEVVVVDRAGNEASFHATVRQLPVGPTGPAAFFGLAATSGDAAPPSAGVPISLALIHPERLPPGSTVAWFVDGAPSGTGAAVEVPPLAAGDHAVRVEVEAPQGSFAETYTLSVAPAGSLAPSALPLALAGALISLGAVGAAVAGTERGRYALLFALIGYVMGRRKPASPLDHFVRGRLYQVISEHPGIHFSELRRRANVSNGGASHHLHVLVRAGLVRQLADRTLTRFYPTDRPLDDESYGLSESDRAVLAVVESSPGLTETQISQRVDRSLSVVSRSVDRLGALGHIRTEQSGRVVSVFPRPAPEAGIGEPSAQGGAP